MIEIFAPVLKCGVGGGNVIRGNIYEAESDSMDRTDATESQGLPG